MERALAGVGGTVGTPRASLPLAAVAASFVGANAWWEGTGSVAPLAGSWPYWAVAVAIGADALWAVLRAVPVAQRADGRLAWTALDRRGTARVLLAASWLLLAVAYAAWLGGRERIRFRVALGEEFGSSPAQVVDAVGTRGGMRAPPPVALGVVGITGGPGPAGVHTVVFERPGAGRKTASSWWPAWVGWGRYLRPVQTGYAVRYELRTEGGALVEGGFAKLDLARRQGDTIRVERVPLRVHVRLAGEGGVRGRPLPLSAAVHRGRLLVADGSLGTGPEPLAFEGLRLSAPEWRPWVDVDLVSSPGLPLAALGLLLAVTGAGLWGASRRSRS